jgi:hypothetical protein
MESRGGPHVINKVSFDLVGYGAWGSHPMRVIAGGLRICLAATADRHRPQRGFTSHLCNPFGVGGINAIVDPGCPARPRAMRWTALGVRFRRAGQRHYRTGFSPLGIEGAIRFF